MPRAKAAPKPLTDFEGHEVVAAKIIVTNTGDGLSQNLKIAPVEYHHGEERIIVMRAVVVKVRHDEHTTKDSDEDGDLQLERVHIFRAGTAIVADEATAAKVEDELAAQEERIKKAKEEAEGTQRLDFPEGDDPAADLDGDAA